MSELPAPSSAELETSAQLGGLIREEIEAAGGAIPFSRYMELCLYAPGLGYYSAGRQKFGPGGDFVTAPEVSLAVWPLPGALMCERTGDAGRW